MSTKEITILIDGDVVAFTAASAVQRIQEDEFGFCSYFANKHEGQAVVDNIIVGLEQQLNATHRKVVLTDPKENFRRQIDPNYKGNRKDLATPLLLSRMKDYLREKYAAFHWDSLEADDVLGILSTEPKAYEGQTILCGKDKDFQTVPGFYHRLKDTDAKGRLLVQEITPWQAQTFHLFQTLTGDATDGYPGCPGIGKTRAAELMDNPVLLIPQPGVITRGPNKGNSTTKWVSEPTRDLWAMVVSHYKKGGQGEQEALVTARLAHILQDEDYNRETGAITLWTPDKIKQQ